MAEWTVEPGRPILGCYLPVGDPAMPGDLVSLYRNSGVDLLEFGLPCADPFLDGPVIADAMARSLAAGFDESTVPEQLVQLRSEFAAGRIVLVTYGNFALAPLRGADGQWLFDACLDLGRLLVSGQPDQRRSSAGSAPPAAGFVSCDCTDAEISAAVHSSLYVMLQASPGRTGGTARLGTGTKARIRDLREGAIKLPILLGIGISTPELAGQAVRLGADGVIIGSRCVTEALRGRDALRRFLHEVREAIDAA